MEVGQGEKWSCCVLEKEREAVAEGKERLGMAGGQGRMAGRGWWAAAWENQNRGGAAPLLEIGLALGLGLYFSDVSKLPPLEKISVAWYL